MPLPDLSPYIKSAAIASSVADITGNTTAGLQAAGYSAWVNSVTGNTPVIERLPDERARLVLREPQVMQMQAWLDSQVGSIFKPRDKAPKVEYEFGPVIKPWALKYVGPAALGLFLAGWVSRHYSGR